MRAPLVLSEGVQQGPHELALGRGLGAHAVGCDDPGSGVLDQALFVAADHHITGGPGRASLPRAPPPRAASVGRAGEEALPLFSAGVARDSRSSCQATTSTPCRFAQARISSLWASGPRFCSSVLTRTYPTAVPDSPAPAASESSRRPLQVLEG